MRRQLAQKRSRNDNEVTANPIVAEIAGRLYPKREKTGDIKFLVDGEVIWAHKCILAGLSPKYEAQFYGNFDDKFSESIEVTDVSADTFKEFLQFFYLDQIKLTHKNIEGVLTLAKASLVNEFFTACIDFLTKSLSTKNVCKTYQLAMLYECEHLIDQCEEIIRLDSDAVFLSNGFVDCSPVALLNILQFDWLNCNEMVLFEACMKWAKNYCVINRLDTWNQKNLRQALGDALFQIRFGTMTIEEFMRCYQTYKNIFTENEREGILYAIGKVDDPKAYLFNDEPRNIQYKKWNENDCIKCDRILPTSLTIYSTFRRSRTTFTSSQPILLGAICSAQNSCMTAEVKIIRKRQLNDTVGKTIFSTTKTFTITTNEQPIFNFQPAIKINPDFFYEIRVHYKDGFYTKLYGLKNSITLDESQTTIDFHDTNGSITGLMVNICEK